MKLENSFYCNTDVVDISKKLIGKVLVTNLSNHLTSGIIVETEAYAGIFDKASHAFNNKRTKRTEIMYKNGGIAYVYLCYGIHNLFNVITNVKDVPHAVLIRAIEPLEGIKEMYRRRKISNKYRLTDGPGKLSQALGIDKNCNGKSLQSDTIWIQDTGIKFLEKDILSSTRIGVDYAGKDAKLLYRFHVKDNKWVSQN
jgi:DNA-3-methyladenine glycosylase